MQQQQQQNHRIRKLRKLRKTQPTFQVIAHENIETALEILERERGGVSVSLLETDERHKTSV
jgi:hypothetical protein